ncbi:MAG: hypothetical protein WCK47_05220 [bacterium]|nr:hypothetical protein [Candidatus Sumerlaeota bacterium]
MSAKSASWKQRVYDQTPKYVTWAGYLLGLAIIGAAASTWFIQTRMYSQGWAAITPVMIPVAAPRDCMVLRNTRKTGDRVSAGDILADVTDDPTQTAKLLLTGHMSAAADELRQFGGGAIAASRAEYDKRLLSAEHGISSMTLRAPDHGWIAWQTPSLAAGLQKSLVRQGGAVATITRLDEAVINIDISADHATTARPNDTVRIMLRDMDGIEIAPLLVSAETTITVEIPNTQFSNNDIERLKTSGRTIVNVSGSRMPAEVSAGNETIVFQLDAAIMPEKRLHAMRAGQSFAMSIDSINDNKPCGGKLGSFQSKFVMRLSGLGAIPKLKQALMDHLKSGSMSFPAGGCWVQVSLRSLFNRLFGK